MMRVAFCRVGTQNSMAGRPKTPNTILPVGTRVTSRVPIVGPGGAQLHPCGAVGVIVKAPPDQSHAYRVRFPDGWESPLKRTEMAVLARVQREGLERAGDVLEEYALFDRVMYRCIIGSRAYGLDESQSDTDRRGIYLPPADLHWSLFGVPEQLESDATQECYWEIQKFLMLALKANPNVLECLYTPIVEFVSPPAEKLLAMRSAFLSRMIYQTFNGYVMSQFRKLEADLRNHGAIKWKHAMHLVRLQLSGVVALREGYLPVRVEAEREELLAIRRGEIPWDEINARRLGLHAEFDRALADTALPERPDYEAANAFLVEVRRSQV